MANCRAEDVIKSADDFKFTIAADPKVQWPILHSSLPTLAWTAGSLTVPP
jgi:hypothetical protein